MTLKMKITNVLDREVEKIPNKNRKLYRHWRRFTNFWNIRGLIKPCLIKFDLKLENYAQNVITELQKKINRLFLVNVIELFKHLCSPIISINNTNTISISETDPSCNSVSLTRVSEKPV